MRPTTFLPIALLACGPTIMSGANDAGSNSEDASDATACDPSNVTSVIRIGAIADRASFADPTNVVSTPTACPTPFSCSYQDYEVDFGTCSGTVSGFRFRYIRPANTNIADPAHVPALVSAPGTGLCWVGTPLADPVDLMSSENGAAVFQVAPRGHSDCYFPNDALYQASDWIGPNMLGDYDRLLLAFVRGWIDPTLQGDPARLGIHGGSHGGISSFLFGRQTHLPAITGQPLALVMPEAGTPDLGAWGQTGFDPSDLLPLLSGSAPATTPWGALRLSGETAQEQVYDGPLFAQPLRADILAQQNLPSWATKYATRSAHDDEAGLTTDTFRGNVKHFLAEMGTQDCIIPHQATFGFYDELRRANMDTARFISPIDYHSCNDPTTTTGYLPRWTGANLHAVNNWSASVKAGWVARYLIGAPPRAPTGIIVPPDPGDGAPTAQGDWLFMLADESIGAAKPKVYVADHLGALATTSRTFSLPGAIDGTQLSYDPAGQGTQLDVKTPQWNAQGAAEVHFDFPITEDFVLVGQPEFVVFVRETSGKPYSFSVVLEDIRPGQPAPWPVSSERRFSHSATSTLARQDILLDTVAHHFKPGDTLRVSMSTLGLFVPASKARDIPMFAPSTSVYSVEFHQALAGAPNDAARIILPTIAGSSLTLAPSAWQVQ